MTPAEYSYEIDGFLSNDLDVMQHLERILKRHKNILIIGAMGIGKTEGFRQHGNVVILEPSVNATISQGDSVKVYGQSRFTDTDIPKQTPVFATYEKGKHLTREFMKDRLLVIDEVHQITRGGFRGFERDIDNAVRVSDTVVWMSGTLDIDVFSNQYDAVVYVIKKNPQTFNLQIYNTYIDVNSYKRIPLPMRDFILGKSRSLLKQGKRALCLLQSSADCKAVKDEYGDRCIMFVGNEDKKTQYSDPRAAEVVRTGKIPDGVDVLVGTTTILEAWSLNELNFEVVIATSIKSMTAAGLAYAIAQFAARLRLLPHVMVHLQVFKEHTKTNTPFNVKTVDFGFKETTKARLAMGYNLPRAAREKMFNRDGEVMLAGKLQHRQQAYDKSTSIDLENMDNFVKECNRYHIEVDECIIDVSDGIYTELNIHIPKNEAMINMIHHDAVPTIEEVDQLLGLGEGPIFQPGPREARLTAFSDPLFAEYKAVGKKAREDLQHLSHMVYKFTTKEDVLEYLDTRNKKEKYKYNGCAAAYRSMRENMIESKHLHKLRLQIHKKFTYREPLPKAHELHRQKYKDPIPRSFTTKELHKYLSKQKPSLFNRFEKGNNFSKDDNDKENRLELMANGDYNMVRMLGGLLKYENIHTEDGGRYTLDLTVDGRFKYDTLVQPSDKFRKKHEKTIHPTRF